MAVLCKLALVRLMPPPLNLRVRLLICALFRYPLCGQRLQHWQRFTNSIEGLDLEVKSLPREEVIISPQRLIKREFLHDLLSRVGGCSHLCLLKMGMDSLSLL